MLLKIKRKENVKKKKNKMKGLFFLRRYDYILKQTHIMINAETSEKAIWNNTEQNFKF